MSSMNKSGESPIQENDSSSVVAQLNLAQILSNIVVRPADNITWPHIASAADVVTSQSAYQLYGEDVNESNQCRSLPEVKFTDEDMLTVSNSEQIDPELEFLLNEIEEMAANHNGLERNNINKSEGAVSNASLPPPIKTLCIDDFVEPKRKMVENGGHQGSKGKGAQDIKNVHKEVEAKPSTSKRNLQSPHNRRKKSTNASLLKSILTNNSSSPAVQSLRNVERSTKKNCSKIKSGQSTKKSNKMGNIAREGGCSNEISRGRHSYENICIDISKDSDSESEFQIFSQSHDRKLFERALRRHRGIEKEVATRQGMVKEIEVTITCDSDNLQVINHQIEGTTNRINGNNTKLQSFEGEHERLEEERRRINEQIRIIDEQCLVIREQNDNLAADHQRFEDERIRLQEIIDGNKARLQREKDTLNALVKKSELVRKKFSDY